MEHDAQLLKENFDGVNNIVRSLVFDMCEIPLNIFDHQKDSTICAWGEAGSGDSQQYW